MQISRSFITCYSNGVPKSKEKHRLRCTESSIYSDICPLRETVLVTCPVTQPQRCCNVDTLTRQNGEYYRRNNPDSTSGACVFCIHAPCHTPRRTFFDLHQCLPFLRRFFLCFFTWRFN